jgi:hypothetical protein
LWCGDTVLKEAFLALFGITRVKDASVLENLEILGGSNQWNVSFSREGHDWEVDVFASFFQVLHSVIVKRGSEDRFWWVSSKRGLFKVKSFFSSLAGSLPLEECVADSGSFESGFFCVVGGPRQDPYFG